MLGQVGDGTNTNRLIPVLVSQLTNIVLIKAGSFHSLVQGNFVCLIFLCIFKFFLTFTNQFSIADCPNYPVSSNNWIDNWNTNHGSNNNYWRTNYWTECTNNSNSSINYEFCQYITSWTFWFWFIKCIDWRTNWRLGWIMSNFCLPCSPYPSFRKKG